MTAHESQDEKNIAIVEELRNVFTPLLEQLTPEVVPATVYRVAVRSTEDVE